MRVEIGRDRKRQEETGRDGKRREGTGRDGKGREGTGDGKRREETGRDGKRREETGRDGKRQEETGRADRGLTGALCLIPSQAPASLSSPQHSLVCWFLPFPLINRDVPGLGIGV